jgi:hypothetical protein
VISLEPERLADVWRNGGEGAGELTLVRKARGREAHKGGSVLLPGSPGDRCLLSWLSRALDEPSCQQESELPLSPFAE